MNVNTIVKPDGDSQSSSYHHQAIMEYDLWVPNIHNPDVGSRCGTGHGTVRKQQQPPHAFQGHYPINRAIGSSQQSPLSMEQYWGQGCSSQQQGGSSVTLPYSNSMFGVYPNQAHTVISSMQHQSPTVLNHQQQQQQQQPQQQNFGMVSNGVPDYHSQQALLSSEQSRPLTPLMPTAQMFTPLQGSHHMGHGSADSSTSVKPPTVAHDNGPPQRQLCPGKGTVAHSSGIQGEYYLQSTDSKNI